MSNERIEWTGTPSQLQNLGWFISCVLLIPIPWAIWRWLVVRNTVFTLTDQRLSTRRGVFNRVTEDLELYRVRDTRLEQTFFERMFGLGEVILFTSDASTPEVHLPWLRDADGLRETVRRLSEARRDAKRVRTLESGAGGHPDLGGHDALD
jgi:uncharacterized membrane protein YdbT with pleckstrin-like domain